MNSAKFYSEIEDNKVKVISCLETMLSCRTSLRASFPEKRNLVHVNIGDSHFLEANATRGLSRVRIAHLISFIDDYFCFSIYTNEWLKNAI